MLQEQVVELKKDIYTPAHSKARERPIQAGDFVKLLQGGAVGKVEALKKDKAIVMVGQLRMTIALQDLVHSGEPLEVQSKRSIQTDTVQQNAGFQSKRDIRGMRMEEALQIVESFVDHALLTPTSYRGQGFRQVKSLSRPHFIVEWSYSQGIGPKKPPCFCALTQQRLLDLSRRM